MSTPTTGNVTNWGFYDDDAGEASSTIIGSVNTNPTLSVDTNYQVRFDCYESNGGSWKNVALQLRYRHKPDGGSFGSWTDVTGASTVVQAAGTGSQLTDGGDTAGNRLGGSFTYDTSNGAQDEVDGAAGDGSADFSSTGAEYVFAFTIISGDVGNNDTIELDVTVSPAADTQNWPSAWPSITVSEASDTDVQANTDALILTENQADITLDVGVNANIDALTLTENQAGITYDVNVQANAVTLTLTEFAAGIVYDVDVQANADSLVLTTFAASLASDTNVQAGVDALTLTGYQAAIAMGIDIQANVDALTLTTYAASLVFDVNVQAATDALILTEYGATLGEVEVVEPGAGGQITWSVSASTLAEGDFTDEEAVALTLLLTG